MRVIRQEGTSHISIGVHDTPTEAGLIQTSQAARVTEITALSVDIVRDNGHVVTDKRPSPEHFLCNCCGEYVHRRGFSPDARNRDGIRHICKQCAAERIRRVRATERYMRVVVDKRMT